MARQSLNRVNSSFPQNYVSVKDFGALGDDSGDGTGTDDSAAIQAAIDSLPNGGTIYIPAGTYRCTTELLIDNPGITLKGAGKGYSRNLLPYDTDSKVEVTRLLFTGTGATSIKTRYTYRSGSGDAQDSPISTAINIENDGVSIRDLMVELYCDYSNTGATNYGDDWDVGIFVGSRQDTSIFDVNVVGYWREASIWLDSTRSNGMTELNGYPATFGAGRDGTTLERVHTIGGKWGIRAQGPLPKTGLMHFGFLYERAAKFAFAGQPSAADTVTVGTDVYTFRSGSAPQRMDVLIGAAVSDTIDNLITKLRQDILTTADDLTFYKNGTNLEIYSTNTAATALAESATNVTLEELGSSTIVTETKVITDPAQYYDQVDGLNDDGRGALGASDLIISKSVICSVEHHSGYRKTDIAVTPDVDTDTAGGAMWINGLGGAEVIHKNFIYGTRFQSVEPFNVRLGFCDRIRFTDTFCDTDVADWLDTGGGALTTADTYGRIAGVAHKCSRIQIDSFDEPGNYFPYELNQNQVQSDFFSEGNIIRGRDYLEAGTYASIGSRNTGSTTGFVDIISGDSANIEQRFSNETYTSVGRIRVASNGNFSISTRPSGTGTIADVLFISGSDKDVTIYGALTHTPVTFSTLPASPVDGMRAFITNCNTRTAGSAANGSGSLHVPVYYDSNDATWYVG